MGTSLLEAICDGTFPDSDNVLSSNIDGSNIPELLTTISASKTDIDKAIRSESQLLASSVDEWIAQAKKVQEEIRQCKLEARKILEEHEIVQSKQQECNEQSSKSNLLRKEILFTESLVSNLNHSAKTNQSLHDIEQLLSENKPSDACVALSNAQADIAALQGVCVRAAARDYQSDLQSRIQTTLEADLDSSITHEHGKEESSLRIAFGNGPSLLQVIPDVGGSVKPSIEKIQTFALEPLQLDSKSGRFLSQHTVDGDVFSIHYSNAAPSVSQVVDFTRDYIQYLYSHLPEELLDNVSRSLIPKVVAILITEWLNPSIPTDLGHLDDFDTMRAHVSSLAQSIDGYGSPSAIKLAQWLEQSPRIWLTKRKAETLDSVRRIFVVAQGNTHQVERMERQKASALSKQPTDDWNNSWDKEHRSSKETSSADGKDTDDTSGWGFDDDGDNNDNQEDAQDRSHANGDVEADAWGWEEDDEDGSKAKKPSSTDAKTANGDRQQTIADSQELILTEYYSVTDIPDHLVEVISRDISDAVTLQGALHPSLSDIPAASGLLALPTLALAMFRATASTHYANASNLGNMNLYNDASYIADKLRDMNAPSGMQTIDADCAAMLKFARSAYAREMDTQRTVLNDLLDGAQGFGNCTQFPYAQEIENAVTTTVDRIRTVYMQWEPILSKSALLQSTGALLSTTIAKYINDIEELEDISEAQSHRLADFTSQFTALEDLFLATPPGRELATEDTVPMTAVYVNNWLKLQYLGQLLDSSLVDIEFLWSQGELSLEFSSEEVVDLVKALFADSSRRKAAITAVKGR